MMQQELTHIAGVTVFSRRRNYREVKWFAQNHTLRGGAETDTQTSDSEVLGAQLFRADDLH